MKESLKKYRFWVMGVGAALVLALSWYFDEKTDPGTGLAATLLWLHGAARPLVLLALAYLAGKAFTPGDAQAAWNRAMEGQTASAILVLGRCILLGLIFFAFVGNAKAAGDLPERAQRYLPVLSGEIAARWPDVPLPSALAAQVEQETCPSLKSEKCWNPRAELKTQREYGFGLGQLTVTPKFNNFNEARRLDASLKDWQFADRYDPARQLRTLLLMDLDSYRRLSIHVPDPHERLAMSFSAYNGGLGGVLADRRLCAQIAGCDPSRWFGHVERHSLKARTRVAGYGQSFFDINRGYVRAVMIERRQRYLMLEPSHA